MSYAVVFQVAYYNYSFSDVTCKLWAWLNTIATVAPNGNQMFYHWIVDSRLSVSFSAVIATRISIWWKYSRILYKLFFKTISTISIDFVSIIMTAPQSDKENVISKYRLHIESFFHLHLKHRLSMTWPTFKIIWKRLLGISRI